MLNKSQSVTEKSAFTCIISKYSSLSFSSINQFKHTDPSEAAEASQHLAVDEAALGRVGQRLVQQVVDEVYAGLHGEDHPLLHQAAHPKTLQSGLVNALHPLEKILNTEQKEIFKMVQRQKMDMKTETALL